MLKEKNTLPEIEENVLEFWAKNKIFEKSVEKRKEGKSFSFYDGPPFATGLPHYGHILATTIKDSVTRFWTMKGYKVERRVGWDCHGLPIENLIEKELGLKDKKDIEKFGIDNFNNACRAAVFRSVGDFQKTLQRVGRWADYSHSYSTLDNDYIESVWWVFGQLWDKGLVYNDYKVAPYCFRCGTPLSNFEVNQGYKNVTDPSLFVKFKVKDINDIPTFFIAWTTTPWTLTANIALAVGADIEYVYALVKTNKGKERFILAKDRVQSAGVSGYKIEKIVKGKDLEGMKYEPVFSFVTPKGKAHIVVSADFVSAEDGTGIVHSASAFGADDMEIAKKNGIEMILTVDKEGRFISDVAPWAGKPVKKADAEIIEYLKSKGLFIKEEKIDHQYPFCWRCDNPLLYYPIESWYIAVKKIRKQLVQNNKKIRWVPSHIKNGRFGKWLSEARDWAVSRNRFWGAPIPVWKCQSESENNQRAKKCGNIKLVTSIKELEKISKKKITDLHRPHIDNIVFSCPLCGGTMKRTEEVFDCWFESGAMPYASWHYPFENKKKVENIFPADFIAEGLDQTRGWFYTLHVLAAALTIQDSKFGKNQPAFKNVIVNGLILDESGRKLSKKLRNYTEPEILFNKTGADAVRYFLLSSTSIGEDYRFSDKGVMEVKTKIIDRLLNSYNFFAMYAATSFKKQGYKLPAKETILDKWIKTRVRQAANEINHNMQNYELTQATRLIADLLDDLSNWYIRRSRARLQRPKSKEDFYAASKTLYGCLLDISKIMAPFTPFISEAVYKSLTDKESVHFENWPNFQKITKKEEVLIKTMNAARTASSHALAKRAENGIKVKQPLSCYKTSIKELKGQAEILALVADEANVKKTLYQSSVPEFGELNIEITDELKKEGIFREITRMIQDLRQKAGLKPKEKASLYMYTENIEIKTIISENINALKKDLSLKSLILEKNDNLQIFSQTAISDVSVWTGIEK